MTAIPSLNIIGAGHLGKVLGRLWQRAGVFEVRHVLNRSLASAEQAVQFIGAGIPAAGWTDLTPADVTLIATPDAEIATACADLARHALCGPGHIVFHCSGALSSVMLNAATESGAATASLHPIRSFADPQHTADHFDGTWCGIEGHAIALEHLKRACTLIGGHPVEIDPESKNIYHAAAVFASNYLVTVLDLALRAYEKAGVPPKTALQMIEPLVRGAVDNVFANGTTAALSGPIARGDARTAIRQYQALAKWDKRVGRAYKALAKPTIEIAKRRQGEGEPR